MKGYRQIRLALVLPALGLGLAALMQRELPAHPVEPAVTLGLEASATLTGRLLAGGDAFAAPTDVEVMGSALVIADDFADHALTVLGRSDGAVLRSFGGKGRGPREFESAYSVDVVDATGRFMVHDVMLQRVTWVDLERDFEDGRWVADRSVALRSDALYLETAWSPGGLRGLGTFREGRLGHLDEAGRLIRTTGPTPLEGEEVPAQVRQQAYQSKLKASPSRERWAVATRYADRLEIFDREGRLVAEGFRPDGFEPRYEAQRSGEALRMASGGDLRFGYLDLATTDERIYALYSGRTRSQGAANYGRRLHVFDWAGRLLDVLELDSPVIAIAVDPSGRELYGIRHDPLPAVMEYRLPARGD